MGAAMHVIAANLPLPILEQQRGSWIHPSHLLRTKKQSDHNTSELCTGRRSCSGQEVVSRFSDLAEKFQRSPQKEQTTSVDHDLDRPCMALNL